VSGATTTNVLVLGHGEMGRALEGMLAGRVALAIWDKYPQPGFRSAVLAEAAPRADVLIFCLPTVPHGQVLLELLPLLRPGCICLSVAKGLDDDGRPVAQIFADVLGDRFAHGVLHGPMIAEEIHAGRLAFAQLGHRGPGVVDRVTALFGGTRLKVAPVTDMLGVNWAVILKNVYTLAFGMADELGLGANVRGWLAVAALAEMDTLVRRLGGSPCTVQGLAGLGDLVTTATSDHSHHRELGRRLARGEARHGPAGLTGEAIHTLAVIGRNRALDVTGLPLFALISRVVRDGADARSSLEELLNR
jgi:glycerol-3-phosphate dehydrogenase (NAD(P)+)